MRALVQRVSEGAVIIERENYKAEIGKGFVVLLGIKSSDTIDDVNLVADKCCNLRRRLKNESFHKRYKWRNISCISIYFVRRRAKRESAKLY